MTGAVREREVTQLSGLRVAAWAGSAHFNTALGRRWGYSIAACGLTGLLTIAPPLVQWNLASALPLTEACCLAEGTICADLGASVCALANGHSQGPGTTCQANPCTLPMATLSVAGAGTGDGTITDSTPGGAIACSSTAGATSGDCTAQVSRGTRFSLVASAATNQVLVRWNGCDSVTTTTAIGDTCTLVLNSDRTITASFQPQGPEVLAWSTISSGGGESGVDGFTLDGTVGQVGVGDANAGAHELRAGFEAVRLPVSPLDVDESGGADAATDMVYIARHLVGLSPVPASYRDLDPNIPPDATIAGRIAAAGDAFDVDGNGRVDPATDVVYIARYLMGLSPVPAHFRELDPNIPPDATIVSRINAMHP